MPPRARMAAVPDPDPGQVPEEVADAVLEAGLTAEEHSQQQEPIEGDVVDEPPGAESEDSWRLRNIHEHVQAIRDSQELVAKNTTAAIVIVCSILLLSAVAKKGAPST